MNSAPVMDSPAVNLAAGSQLPQLPAAPPLKGDNASPAAPFGAVLEKASAKVAVTIESDEADDTGELADPLLPLEESVEEKEKPIIDVLPLVCFCPPPEIKVLPPPPPPKDATDLATEKPIESAPTAAIEIKSSKLQTAARPETELPELVQCATEDSTSIDLGETVRPKEKEGKEGKAAGKFSTPKIDSGKRIELDPEIFKAVPPTPVELTQPQVPKPPPGKPIEAPPVFRGTVVAQLGNTMKNGGKTAEIASGIEQKAPVQEVSRRPVAPARFDNSGLISSAPARISADFKVEGPAEMIPVKSAAAIHIVESIRTEVASLRQVGQSGMSLVLKPDTGTELKIQVSIGRDGSIQAQAHCARGDFQALNAQWPQLQQSLAAHGIQMTNLSNTGNQNQNQAQQQHSSEQQGGGNFAGAQNFDRGHHSQNRQRENTHTFEEELAASTTPRFSTSKTIKQTATGATRRWQSWA
jgi:hypothetical protein